MIFYFYKFKECCIIISYKHLWNYYYINCAWNHCQCPNVSFDSKAEKFIFEILESSINVAILFIYKI